jgi:hypothetical protein
MAVIDRDRGYNKILRELQKAARLEVVIGVHQGATNAEDGASIAEYGAANEFGADSVGVPSRPFMRTAFDENVGKINSDIQKQVAAISGGKRDAVQALDVIGLKHTDRIKKTITGRNFLPKLKPETIARKKGSTKTLVDTGALVNSIHHVTRGKT